MNTTPSIIVSIGDKSHSKLNTISIAIDDSNSKFDETPFYTKRHDHGSLPEMKSFGYYNNLIASLQECKDFCDVTITGMMVNESTQKGTEVDEVDDDNLDREEKKQKCK